MKRFYGNDAEDPVRVDSGELKIFFKWVKPKMRESRKRFDGTVKYEVVG